MNHQQFNKRTDFVLRETWKNIEKMYNKEANLYDVTFSISFTLISIDPDIGSPSTSIGPVMGLEANSISRILNSMENKKLIYRKPNPTDGRSIIISLTKSGLKKRKIVIEKIRKFKSIIQNRIDKKDLNSFHKVINQINEIIYEGNVFID